MTNALTTLSTLEQQITATTERLRPAGEDAVAKTLRSLQAAGLGLPSGMKPEDVTTVYSYALSGLSNDALNTAAKKLIRGEYPIERKAFIPTPPELAAIVRAEARQITDDLIRMKATAESMKPKTVEQVSEEGRERVRKMLRDFRADHRTAKEAQRGVVVEADESPEQIDRWDKIISTLKDRHDMTPEQIAYRNAVAKRVEASKAKHTEAAGT